MVSSAKNILELIANFSPLRKDTPEQVVLGKDGLKYCQLCKKPRECVVTVEGEKLQVPIPCDCQKQRLERESAAEKERRKIQQEEERKRGITEKKYLAMNFQASTQTLGFAHKYVENFSKYFASNTGLMLVGGYGTGKTFAAACIANALAEKGYSVYMAHIVDITRRLSQTFDPNLAEFQKKLQTCSLLVVDDFGAQRNSDFMREQVDYLIDLRYRAEKPLIITSNLTMEELRAADGIQARAYDRLKEMCGLIRMQGESLRVQKANERNQKLWEELGC